MPSDRLPTAQPTLTPEGAPAATPNTLRWLLNPPSVGLICSWQPASRCSVCAFPRPCLRVGRVPSCAFSPVVGSTVKEYFGSFRVFHSIHFHPLSIHSSPRVESLDCVHTQLWQTLGDVVPLPHHFEQRMSLYSCQYSALSVFAPFGVCASWYLTVI